MAVAALALPRLQLFDSSGRPLAGGLLDSYAAGTSTPLATYTDSGGLTPQSNPIVLDSGGYADVWLTTAVGYKFRVRNSAGVVQYTIDNITLGAVPRRQRPPSRGVPAIPSWSSAGACLPTS